MSAPKSQSIKVDGTKFVAFPEAGCFYGVDSSGTLWQIPLMEDSSPDTEKVEVTAFENPAILNSVNRTFGTKFKLADFAGR